ncbi:MAG TPA: DUF952 domain-containing protein [Thermomicrobiales bacterium]|nr:DUF952 domain-containing protein [Thermomicrobiales bacterium]
MKYATASECRSVGVTYHLVPAEDWERQKDQVKYVPAAFDADGFIHCTNGLDELVAVGNRFYQDDQRRYLALILNVPAISSPVRYDDPDQIYPHIYGPLNTNAVVGMLEAQREDDGTFLSFSRGDRSA